VIASLLVVIAQLALPVRPDSTGRTPAIVTRAPLDTNASVNFRVLVSPDTVYVGEQTIYELGVFLDEEVRDRLRRMEAIAPEMRGMMAYDPPAPSSGFPFRVAGGHRYEAHVYQRAIFPLAAGRIAIPPARLVYAMPLSYSYFSREESYELTSDSAIIIAVEPPRATRPPDWAGAVGALRVSARVDTTAVRVGDPVLLTVAVSGRGNVKLFPRPRLAVPRAAVVPAAERVDLGSDSLHIEGVKEFDWILTPLAAGRVEIPAVRYPYFDPEAGRYEVATTGRIALDVAPGSLASLDTGMTARPRWPVRATYRGAIPRPPYEGMPFWWVMALVPVPAVALLLVGRPRGRRAPVPPARQLHALERQAEPEPALVRRSFLEATASRIQVPALALAEPRALHRAARRAGTSDATAAAAAALLEELNRAAFGADGRTEPDLARRAVRVYEAIAAEARRPRPQRPARVVTVVATFALALAATARATSPDPEADRFALGVTAYDRGHYGIAFRQFATVAAHVPRSPDAWANMGTAAFAAGDTARAMLGWQRALRLEPLAGDVRDRVEMLGTGSGGIGAVPPIPPLPLALTAALLWVGSWLFIAWCARSRRRGARLRPGAALALLAVVLGAATAAVDRRLAARDLVVVAHDAPLHLLPALGSERRATARTGEIARVVEREGVWAHVIVDGGREGWTDGGSLYSLRRD
jgi:hypothetical protein